MPDASGLNRRRFLKNAALAGAGLTLSASLPVRGEAAAADSGAGMQFALKFDAGAVVSLRRVRDRFDTDYVQSGQRLGDIALTYRQPGGAWQSAATAELGSVRTAALSADGRQYAVTYSVQDSAGPALSLQINFDVRDRAVLWTMTLHNATDQPLEIGDLALPLPMNTEFQEGKPATASVLKHSFVSGMARISSGCEATAPGRF